MNTQISQNTNSHKQKLVWVDCDPGHDDYLALLMVVASDNFKLVGISTTFGNSEVENCTQNALGILELFKVDKNVKVYQGQSQPLVRDHQQLDGFHGHLGFSVPLDPKDRKAITTNVYQSMFEQMKQISEENENQTIEILTLASLTNIAKLITDFPESKQYIHSITGMFGSIISGNCSPNAEHNAYADPEATQIVLQSGVQVMMAPLELEKDICVPNNYVEKLLSIENQSDFVKTTIQCFEYVIKRQYEFYRKYIKDEEEILKKGVPMYDISASYYLIAPNQFKTQFYNVVCECKSEYCDGMTVVDVKNNSVTLCLTAFTVKADSTPLNFGFYYESLCPYCQVYMKTAWQEAVNTKDLLQLFSLDFYPYGNAKETKNGDRWEFTCQHGSVECYGNQMETCLLSQQWDNEQDKLNSIICIESEHLTSNKDFDNALEKCASEYNYNVEKVKTCITSSSGNYLQHQVAIATNNLNPPHKWVPWLVVNGKYDEDVQDEVESDPVQYICQNSGDKAKNVAACEKYLGQQKIIKEINYDYQVCYNDRAYILE
ncbi:Inosine/uridine-preferring nucleoside hydrolase domain [Pseudocohnilembus persalinus]|uniref:Inosine/uridine-preferring nucleoside hydrolase domain n=1 Tax=Pseudocohnilembus persalinus TaxID=266149 RepID=A0A0V0Q865_PSEPJ|nr:Inosine/uridine-preferring nucleoside hydrolase domain [Pseudocohnilembus persalinus]|eukprot:KRW98244.1 Inosine/uridine-preferring nucleoside hydrolase domain [Pseudocohnilembus persalinus]